MRFSSISRASVCANLTTVPLAAASLQLPYSSSTFKSSELVACLTLQPVPRRNSHCCKSLQWAQGKTGEDRTHLVVSEEQGWIYVRIYDGFSPHHLLTNLFNAVFEERGLLWNNEGPESDEATGFDLKKWKCDYNSQRFKLPMNSTMQHSYVLKALPL
ncbi:hypothetical protein V6N11_036721 [Hibiscus sabdariffa]|uniref:Uncharacterized protein n=1 Tax=Hibiscus sabdariffa TaxID=183260 RepID=A0ABR2RBN8_9ROSI